MRLIYLTGLNYPSAIANNQQVKAMASEFRKVLGDNFVLVVNSSRSIDEFGGYQPITIGCSWKHFRFLYSSWWFFRHIRSLKKGDAQTVIYTKDPYFCLISIFFKKIFGYKVAFESHLLFSPLVNRLIARYADSILALTSHLKNDLVSLCGASAGNIGLFPDAVAVSEFDLGLSLAAARGTLGLPIAAKIAMYTGSFYVHEWKGLDVLVRAAGFLPPGYLIVLVGARDERERERVSKVIQENPAGRGGVLVIGRQDHTDIPLYLQAADVLVLPNTRGNANSEKYTSPLKLFEYMAARRPIVASDLPSIREVLSEENSFLVEPGKPEELAKTIQRAATDSVQAKHIAERAWQDVKDLTWQNRASGIIAFITTTHA